MQDEDLTEIQESPWEKIKSSEAEIAVYKDDFRKLTTPDQ